MQRTKFAYLRFLCFLLTALYTTINGAVIDPAKKESGTEDSWSSIDSPQPSLPSSEQVSCQGQLCVYGNRQVTRRKLLKRKTTCGPDGCFMAPKSNNFDQELDSAELDSYGIQYNDLKRRAPCEGQMCWFRGKRGKLTTKEVRERLQAQLSFLQNLNKRQEGSIKSRRTTKDSGCTGQMCWFRGKKEFDQSRNDAHNDSPCVGQMCWFRGKRTSIMKQRKPCVGQMCWFRGKKQILSGEERSRVEKRCTGQMCWFRGKRQLNSKDACKGQMCWFRGKRQMEENVNMDLE